MKANLSRRRISSTGDLHKRNSVKDPIFVKTKSQLVKFEKKKEFYIRHVEKMSPEKTK